MIQQQLVASFWICKGNFISSFFNKLLRCLNSCLCQCISSQWLYNQYNIMFNEGFSLVFILGRISSCPGIMDLSPLSKMIIWGSLLGKYRKQLIYKQICSDTTRCSRDLLVKLRNTGGHGFPSYLAHFPCHAERDRWFGQREIPC